MQTNMTSTNDAAGDNLLDLKDRPKLSIADLEEKVILTLQYDLEKIYFINNMRELKFAS